jgi:hypothetical protein
MFRFLWTLKLTWTGLAEVQHLSSREAGLQENWLPAPIVMDYCAIWYSG